MRMNYWRFSAENGSQSSAGSPTIEGIADQPRICSLQPGDCSGRSRLAEATRPKMVNSQAGGSGWGAPPLHHAVARRETGVLPDALWRGPPRRFAAWEESAAAGHILPHEMGRGTARRAVEGARPHCQIREVRFAPRRPAGRGFPSDARPHYRYEARSPTSLLPRASTDV
jgi:hypothetical protein